MTASRSAASVQQLPSHASLAFAHGQLCFSILCGKATTLFSCSAVSLCWQRPVKWCSSFVVGKQVCQTIAAKKMNSIAVPYRHFYSCNALRMLRPLSCLGCSVSLCSLSYCLQLLRIPHGSSCVLHSPSFNHSCIAFHCTSFADPLMLQRLASCPTHKHTLRRMHMHFRKPAHTAHRVPLHCIPSGFIQYCSVHPLPHFFARRPPLQAAFTVCC